MASSDEHFMTETRKPFILREFVECYKLPVCAKVVGCRGLELRSPETPIRCGDYINLQTLVVDSISLSFYDADTGSKRAVRVPADSNVKFNVVSTPTGSGISDVMPTVIDVIKACPMKFRANTEHDDPYLPIIFKKGEEFRYLRKCRCPSDGTVYLECEDSSGNVIQLPKTCKGNFTVIEDKTSYTLREIIAFGPVSRKLKLSNDNIKLLPIDNDSNIDPEIPLYTNLNEGDTLTRTAGLPLTFNGVITMQEPDLFLLASSRDNLIDKWKVSLDLDIDLVLAPNDEYEEPTKKERILHEFISDFEQDLPLVATLSGYKNIPKEFRKVLSKNSDILVHHVETSEKILACSKGVHFCIGKGLKGRFRRALSRFESLSELVTLNRVLTVKIMEDVASDVPEPFSLKVGDLLKFENHNIQTIKIKYSKTNRVKCDTIVCEKIETDKNKHLRLPIDLEVSMIEILPENEQDGNDISYIFSRRTKFPLMVDFLPIHHHSQPVLPYDSELELSSRVSDPLVLISPLPLEKDRRVSALDAKLDQCLLVPVRHRLYLKVKSKLNFPSSYFRLPKREEWLILESEKITKDENDSLFKYNDQAYEDYDPRSMSYHEEEECLDKIRNENSSYKQLRRKGTSMTILPQLKRHSRIFTKKDRKYRSDSNLQNATKDDEGSEPDTDGERIYELYEAPYRTGQDDKKSSKSLKSKLLKRLSLRKKKKSDE